MRPGFVERLAGSWVAGLSPVNWLPGVEGSALVVGAFGGQPGRLLWGWLAWPPTAWTRPTAAVASSKR